MSASRAPREPGDRGGAPGPTRTVYLAHPIDNGWFNTAPVRDALLQAQFAVFDPGAAWKMPQTINPTDSITRGLFALMAECDGVLACLPKHTLTVGTVMEIAYAAHTTVPVVIFSDMGPSWALASLPAPIPVVADLEQAVATLSQLVRG